MKLIISLMIALTSVNAQDIYSSSSTTSDIEDECKLSTLPPDPDSQCCGVDISASLKIMGGEQTGLRQYPWLVLIENKITNNGRMYTSCGGFLISGRYVVTAGHCVYAPLLNTSIPTSVRLGDYNRNNKGPDCITTEDGEWDCIEKAVSIPIENITLHEKFIHRNNWNDIALIRLKTIVNYTDTIRPICLPTTDIATKQLQNLRLYVAGWGVMNQTKLDNGKYMNIKSGIKRHVDLPLVNIEQCLQPPIELYPEKQVCAGGESGKDACMGDSGVPLMKETSGVFEAVGIVSYGTSEVCGEENVPGVYTKVFAYRDWIMNHILSFE